MDTKPQILYFDIRGRAEPIRLILEDQGVPYVDNLVTLDEWPAIRDTTPFKRMPVYREGDLVIPESFAIMNYLGRKHGLRGDDEAAQLRCDITIEAWRDYGNRVANTFGALSTSEAARKTFIEEEQPQRLADLESFYLERGFTAPYWAANTPTIADFAAFHLIEGIANQLPGLLERFKALGQFHEAFRERPNIKAYLASSRRPAALFYGPNGKIFPRQPAD